MWRVLHLCLQTITEDFCACRLVRAVWHSTFHLYPSATLAITGCSHSDIHSSVHLARFTPFLDSNPRQVSFGFHHLPFSTAEMDRKHALG